MRRIGEFYRQEIPELKLASGYHDPVTTRFIDATEPPAGGSASPRLLPAAGLMAVVEGSYVGA